MFTADSPLVDGSQPAESEDPETGEWTAEYATLVQHLKSGAVLNIVELAIIKHGGTELISVRQTERLIQLSEPSGTWHVHWNWHSAQ